MNTRQHGASDKIIGHPVIVTDRLWKNYYGKVTRTPTLNYYPFMSELRDEAKEDTKDEYAQLRTRDNIDEY